MQFNNLKVVNNEDVARKPEVKPPTAQPQAAPNPQQGGIRGNTPRGSSAGIRIQDNANPLAPQSKAEGDKPQKPSIPLYPPTRVPPPAIDTAMEKKEDPKVNPYLQRSPSNNNAQYNHQQAIEREKEKKRRDQKEKELLQRQKEEREKEQKLKEARDRELKQKLDKEKEQRMRDAKERELREKKDKQLQLQANQAKAHANHNPAQHHRVHHQMHPQHIHIQQQNLFIHQQQVNHKKQPLHLPVPPNEQKRKIDAAKKPFYVEPPKKDEDDELRRRVQKEQELEEKKRQRDQERQQMLNDIKHKKMQMHGGRDKTPELVLKAEQKKDYLDDLMHADPKNFSPQEFHQNINRIKDNRSSDAKFERPASSKNIPKAISSSAANLNIPRQKPDVRSPANNKAPYPSDKLQSERSASKQAKQLDAQSNESKPTDASGREKKMPDSRSRNSDQQSRGGRDSSANLSAEETEFIFSKVPPRRNSSQERNLFEYSATTGVIDGPVFSETAHFAPELEDLIEGIKQASGRIDERFERETNELFINDRPVVPTTNLDFITVDPAHQIKKKGPAIKVEDEDPEYHLSSFGQLEDLRMQIEKKIGPEFFSLYSKVKEAVVAPHPAGRS